MARKVARADAYVIGRPLTNYLLLGSGSVAVDAIVDRLADDGELKKGDLETILRKAVLSAHEAGSREIVKSIRSDPASAATAALRALRPIGVLVNDPTFIPAIRLAVPIIASEHPSFGDDARKLANALDKVTLLESILADARRGLKPVERQNPGKPYMVGLAESLVAFWHRHTGEFPSKTRILAKRSKSLRVLFWDFADRALTDLYLQGQPIEHHVRSAIKRLQKGEIPPSNS